MENPVRSEFGEDGSALVAVLGEIDFANADEVAQAIRDTVAGSAPTEVRIDLADAAFIDSTGLGALIEGYRAVTEAGSRFRVVNPSASFHRVLTVTGLCELFGMPEGHAPADLDRADLDRATGA